MTVLDTAARFTADGRRMARSIGDASDYDALIAEAGQRFTRVHRVLQATEDKRRLRIDDDLTVRRRGDHIALVLGPAEIPLTNEQARRAAEALSFYAATTDAVDVEDDEMGRAA